MLRHCVENYQLTNTPYPKVRHRNSYPFQILIFHRVLPDVEPFAIDLITTRAFSEYLGLLSGYFRVVSLETILKEVERNELKPNTVSITFDDGYRDNFEYAFPILKHHGLPATIFLTTDVIGTDRMLWHDRVLQAMKFTKINRLNFEEANILNVDIADSRVRRRTAFAILRWLKQFAPIERDKRIQQLLSQCGTSQVTPERLMLNWQEIRQMQKSGISFGAHTKSHPILSLLSEGEIEEEICASKTAIENFLGVSVSVFAYPNGQPVDFNAYCKRVLKKSGFHCAVTTCLGINSANQDAYELFRFRPWDSNPYQFLGRLIFTRFSW